MPHTQQSQQEEIEVLVRDRQKPGGQMPRLQDQRRVKTGREELRSRCRMDADE